MKVTIRLTNGKRIQRTGNYQKIAQDININRVVWHGFVSERSEAVWEVPQKILKSITIQY